MEINLYQNNFSNKYICLWKMISVVLVFILVLALILIFNNGFYDYYEGNAIFEDPNKFSTLVNINDLEKITSSRKIVIEGTTFSYDVLIIDDNDYVYGNEIFKKIHISLNCDNCSHIKNKYSRYYIILGHDTIFNYFIKNLKGDIV